MTAFWQQLEPRQRSVIAAGLAVVILALAWVWVWEPLAEAREAERERIARQQALLDWLEAVTPLAERLRQGGPPAADPDGRSLLGVTDETARAAGLAGALARIEPTGDGRVRVWLEEAAFIDVMEWLERFSRAHPVRIDRMQVDRARAEGTVNVRATLTRETPGGGADA
jgi:general secretion pathway protein M